MFDLSILDEEEIILLLGSGFNLLFTFSLAFNLIKLFRHKYTYDVFPIITLFFCYINGLIWTQYSDLIYHESMKSLFQYSNILSCAFIIIYSIYELRNDIIDTILNILILVTSSWAVKKLLQDILKEEEKVKTTCCYSIIVFYLTILEWIYRSRSERNTNILNFISGLFLLASSCCWVYYGFKYEDKFFLLPNLLGILMGVIYIFIWYEMKKKYGYVVPKKKEKKEDKKEEEKNKDEKEKKEEKENKKEEEIKNENEKKNIVDEEHKKNE